MTAVVSRTQATTWPRSTWLFATIAAAFVVAVGIGASPYVALAAAALAVVTVLGVVGVQPMLALMIVAVFFELARLGGATLTRVVAPVALLVLVVEIMRRGTGLAWNGLLVSVWAYSTWALASGMWTVDTDATVYLLQSLAIALVFMVAFAVLPESLEQLTKTLQLMIACSVIVGLIAIGAFMGVLTFDLFVQGGRAQGVTGDPNFFANVQLVSLPIAIVLAGEARSRWSRLTLIIAAQVIIASVLVTLSRGGFLSAIAQLLLLVGMRSRTLFRSPRDKKLLLLVLAAGFAFVMSGETLRGDVTKRFESIFSPSEDDSGSANGSGREAIWAGARVSIAERPVLGLGYGAFAPVSNDLILRAPDADLTNFELKENGIEVHNVYLSTTAELGYPGLVLFCSMLASMLVLNSRTRRLARAAGTPLIARLAAALDVSHAGWAISSIFISTETSRPLWILFGLSLALARLVPASAPARSNGIGVVAPVAARA